MAELVWGGVGQRYFESGVDRGVLYPRVGPGVAWSGLTAIDEKPDGGSPRPFYADGFKYLNLASAEEYAATISAFSAPPEFAACDGTQSILNGLFITQQRRQQFGLSYRTKVGNDVDGVDHGYKIHLVYNALASATSRNYQTLSSSLNPVSLSWNITTNPPEIMGYRPSAHFVIDSMKTPIIVLRIIESILYGSPGTEPRLPSVGEIISIFESYIPPQYASYDIAENETTGLWPITIAQTVEADLYDTVVPGIFTIPFDSSIVLDEDGFYTLE